MQSRSSLSVSSDSQRLEVLARSIRYLSCGKLKRASQLIAEADNTMSNSIDSDEMRDIIIECQRLGLVVQSRKFLSKADALLFSGENESALRKYSLIGIAGLHPDISFQVLHNKAVCLTRQNEFGEAIEHFREALLRFPQNPFGMQNLAFALMANREYKEALHMFSEVIRRDDVQPGNLLHILYGSAECRKQLNMSEQSTDLADNTLQMIQEHQTQMRLQAEYFSDGQEEDLESYNDYGLSYHDSFQDIPHMRFQQLETSGTQQNAIQYVPTQRQFTHTTQVPFRRLRYQEPIPEEPRGTLSIETSLEKMDFDDTDEQSPLLSVRSKHKRDVLRRVVGEYDRSVLVKSPVQQEQVHASLPTLHHRARLTDPSPGMFAIREPDVRKAERLATTQEEHHNPGMAQNIYTSVSVSSTKPKLSAHHRSPPLVSAQHVAPQPPATVQTAPLHPIQPTLPPKLDLSTITIQSKTEDLLDLSDMQGDSVSASSNAKLAPAVPLTAPMFIASPLPRPRGGSGRSGTKAPVASNVSSTSASALFAAKSDVLDRKLVVEKSQQPAASTILHLSAGEQRGQVAQSATSIDTCAPVAPGTPLSQSRRADISSMHPANESVQGSHKPGRPARHVSETPASPVVQPTMPVEILVSTATMRDAPHAPTPPPLCAGPTSSTTSVYSAPPDTIDGSVEVSSKPRRPSRVPDLDTSPPVCLPIALPKETFTDHSMPSRHVTHDSPSVQDSSPPVPLRPADPSDLNVSARANLSNGNTPTSHSSAGTVMSGISAESTSAPTSEHASSAFRYSGAHAAIPALSEASEQQQEMDRVFEGRRYVDNYTVTNADVIKLRAEFQQRFPSSSGLPTVAYPYTALRSPGPYPPNVDIRIREMYLSDAEFQALFHTSRTAWLGLPEWRQRSMKKNLGLF